MKSIQGHNNLGNSAFRRPAAHGLTCGSLRCKIRNNEYEKELGEK